MVKPHLRKFDFLIISARISERRRLLVHPAELYPSSLLFLLVTWCGVKWVMLCLLILMTATVSGSLSPDPHRMNYGIVFEPEAQLQLSKENWIHTFEVQLPEDISMIQLSGCTRDINTCSIVNDILLEINQIRQETALVLNHTIETIKNLVPEREQASKGRTTRSVLPFVEDLSKTLFGTATWDDVQLLGRHINALNKLTRNVVKSVQQHEDNMSSYLKTETITNIMQRIKENGLAITHIQSQLFESFENLERSFTSMAALLSKQIKNLGNFKPDSRNLFRAFTNW